MRKKVKFINLEPANADFFKTLRKRVNDHFQTNSISKTGGWEMVGKILAMYALFFVPYGLILSGTFAPWAMALLCIVMGFGIAGIGLSVMHDANHGALSNSSRINNLVGYSLNLIGGCSMTWRMQHNVLHHTYTNIPGYDEDINNRAILRFSPEGKRRWIHRFQHQYAFFLYGFMTISWVLVKDFFQLTRYRRMGMFSGMNLSFRRELMILILSKIVFFSYFTVIPLLVLDITWWQYLIGFFLAQYTAGLVLAVIFQMAHVIEETIMPNPTAEGTIENQWAIHQLHTTANFATDNSLLNWYAGGLNFQVEHHLFPRISHVHYKSISKIVKETALEHGIPYHEKKTLWQAIQSHRRLLKRLGQPDPVPVVAQA